jgi:nitroreductase
MPTIHDFDLAATQQRAARTTGVRDDRELIRCATLAASSHNSQPWRFRLAPDAITILPDPTRRCSVVDPDDAHLFKSLGCAAENLVQAAAAQGFDAEVRFDAEHDAVAVGLMPSTAKSSTEWFEAISTRQSTRLPFDGTPVSTEDLDKLELAGHGPGVRIVMITDPEMIAQIGEFVAAGDTAQLTDREFRRELRSWIRFNPTTALRTGDGLAGRCAGSPSLPTWLGRLLAPLVIRARPRADRDTANIRSSAGIVVFATEHDDRLAWIEAGRAYQRLALQATALDIRTAFINQPIEVRSLRSRFEAFVGLDGEHAQLAIRLGHGELAPYSLRRPIDEVIASPEHSGSSRQL